MKKKWDDEREAALIRVLYDLLPTETLAAIERTSSGSNVRWSDVTAIALASADWNRIEDAINTLDTQEALAEAEHVISPGGQGREHTG